MMALRRIAASMLALVLAGPTGLMLSSVHADTAPALLDRIVAVVNDEVITLSELNEAKARLRLTFDTPRFFPSPTDGAVGPEHEDREVLRQLIERRLQVQMARKRGIVVTSEETDQFLMDFRAQNGLLNDSDFEEALQKEDLTPEQYRRDAEEQLMILKLATREAKEGILLDEKELLRYYEEHRDDFRLPDGYRLRQILLSVPDPDQEEEVLQEARNLVFNLRSGADFGAMVAQYSRGPEAKDEGRLGFVERSFMLPEVEVAVTDLPPGGISDPVRTAAGVHLFLVEEVQRGAIRPFKEVRPAVRDKVFQQHVAKRYQQWVGQLRREAHVEIKF
jgi:peptidyl-prolyl cis-trans isomerase SurA